MRVSSSMEFKFVLRPILNLEEKWGIAPSQESCDLHQEIKPVQEQDQEKKCKFMEPKLEVKLPTAEEFKIKEDDEDDNGFKTPTSLNHKIPVILQCPPAPRKPKSLQSSKRKFSHRRILLDQSIEIESLFPPSFLTDLGAKIKKARQENDS